MDDWTEQDAVALREYLATPSGQKLLIALERPENKGKTFEKVALESRYADGVDAARKIIISKSEVTRKRSADPGNIQFPD